MAAHLIEFDAEPDGTTLVKCRCGFRSLRLSLEAARATADRHRAELHPRQAQYAASKRRVRAAARAAELTTERGKR